MELVPGLPGRRGRRPAAHEDPQRTSGVRTRRPKSRQTDKFSGSLAFLSRFSRRSTTPVARSASVEKMPLQRLRRTRSCSRAFLSLPGGAQQQTALARPTFHPAANRGSEHVLVVHEHRSFRVSQRDGLPAADRRPSAVTAPPAAMRTGDMAVAICGNDAARPEFRSP